MALRSCIAVLLLAFGGWAADPPAAPVCASGEFAGVTGCTPSGDDIREAKHVFNQGLKFEQQGKLDRAFDAFALAQKLTPANVEYASAHEIVRQRLVMAHLQRGNLYLADKRQVEALAEFRGALELDPSNEFAQQRLRDALGDDAPQIAASMRLVEESSETELAPRAGTQDIRFRGDTRALIEEIGRRFGIRVGFDQSFASRPVKFNADGITFSQAMTTAMQMSKAFWAPMAADEILVASDTQENRRQYERMSVRTYYVSGAGSAEEMNQIAGVFRALFDIRFVSIHPAQSLLQVRGPKGALDAAAKLIEVTAQRKPQVMLEVRVYEVAHRLLRQLGIDLPLQFRIFNIPSSALILQQNPNIQDLINQLIASGGINQATGGDLAALLAALQSQQNGIFSQPFATFGGGVTLTGISIPNVKANFSHDESWVRTLEHMTLRAADGNAATFRVGSRFPILNASFAPIFNTPAISQVIQNQSFQAPFPSFTFEDLGLTLKATPQVHGSDDVSLKLETSIKALGGQVFNSVPVLTNREYNGSVRLKDGESAMILGYVAASETKSLRGLPGISKIPGLGLLTSTQGKEVQETEIMLMVTPHILSPGPEGNPPEIWLNTRGQ